MQFRFDSRGTGNKLYAILSLCALLELAVVFTAVQSEINSKKKKNIIDWTADIIS